MLERDINWITEEPGDKALDEGVAAMIQLGLDGPDGVGRSDALAVWQAMARTMRTKFEAIGEQPADPGYPSDNDMPEKP